MTLFYYGKKYFVCGSQNEIRVLKDRNFVQYEK